MYLLEHKKENISIFCQICLRYEGTAQLVSKWTLNKGGTQGAQQATVQKNGLHSLNA
jgi:hypothetical protein